MRSRIFLIILTALTVSCFLPGCKKLVDLDPVELITKDSALKTEADFIALLNSTYTVLAADSYWGGRWQITNDLMTDHMAQGELSGNYLGIYNRSVDIFNTNISGLYTQPWYAIARANAVMENIDRLSGATKDNILGQAKFVRALGHFDLVRLWARPYAPGATNDQLGIPIKETSTPGAVTRATVEQVYAKVISDLKDAEATLPDVNGVYPTKWSAKALLARIYFQRNDFTNAYNYANQVIASGKFAFDTDVMNRYSKNGTTEAVFQLIYEANNPQGRFNELRNSYRTTQAGLPACRVSTYLANKAMTTLDKRKAWYKTVNGNILTTKFDSLSFKVPVLHLTEMKLIRAESAAELNTNLTVATQDINDIINRAYGAGSPLVVPGGSSASFIKDAVRRERELEMVFEGDRLQELKRQGAKGENIVIRGAPWNCNGLVMIFPTNEVFQNPGFQQNPIGGCQ